MPRLSKKDAGLLIDMLRRHVPVSANGETDAGRLLRRLEERTKEPSEALRNWKRRGHTEMVQQSSRKEKSTSGNY